MSTPHRFPWFLSTERAYPEMNITDGGPLSKSDQPRCKEITCTCFRNGHCIAIGLSGSMDILEQQRTNRRLPEIADYHAFLISYHLMSLTKP